MKKENLINSLEIYEYINNIFTNRRKTKDMINSNL